MTLVIDCHSHELLGWQLARNSRSKTAGAALKQALTHDSERWGCASMLFLRRSDNRRASIRHSFAELP
jgi:putative transposase